jgi:hypothetical protein
LRKLISGMKISIDGKINGKMAKMRIGCKAGRTISSAMDAMPEVVDRAAFEAKVSALRLKEKAHMREGDAIALARRRLPRPLA